VRPGWAGLALLAVAAVGWTQLVAPTRERAQVLAEERRTVEQERAAATARVAALERRAFVPEPSAADGGVVGLRAAVVAALDGLQTVEIVQLTVRPTAGGPEAQLSLAGGLDEVLDLVAALAHPVGPLALDRVEMRPRNDGTVQLELVGQQPGKSAP